MKRYKKLIVASIGLALLALKDLANLDLPYSAESLYTVVVSFLTLVGVEEASND